MRKKPIMKIAVTDSILNLQEGDFVLFTRKQARSETIRPIVSRLNSAERLYTVLYRAQTDSTIVKRIK